MKQNRFIFVFVWLILMTSMIYAGSLNPPAPPTSGTMKPLDEVEPRIPISSVPYEIYKCGSYYLTKNLTATGMAIIISVDDVTLDLGGFTLTGPGAASGTTYGVYMSGRKNVEIRNGTIKSFGYDGVYDNAYSSNHRLVGLQVIGNGRHGIYLYSSGGNLVKDCTVSDNGNSFKSDVYGIYVSNGTVTNCVVYNNGIAAAGNASGIYTGSCCRVIGNTVYSNGGSAVGTVFSIMSNSGSTIADNTVYSNGGNSKSYVYGIIANPGCTLTGNTVYNNGIYSTGPVYGVSLQDNCSMTGNTIYYNNGTGVTVTKSCQVINNSVNSNSSTGLSAGNNSIIRGNTVDSNASDGINAGDHVTITDNTITNNTGSGIVCTGGYVAKNTVSLNNTATTAGKGGIVVSNHSQVKDNTLEGNSKNNIYITGFRNSIEGNVMSGSDYGINFGSLGNLYLNNRATCNGINYNPVGNTDGGGNISF